MDKLEARLTWINWKLGLYGKTGHWAYMDKLEARLIWVNWKLGLYG